MSEFPGYGFYRSPRPWPPLRVRRDGRFGVLEVVQGAGTPQASVLCDTVTKYPKVGVVEASWGQFGHRLFSDRWLITKGARALGQEVVLATTIMGDPDPEMTLEDPLELRLPSGLNTWKAYALPDIGRWAMVYTHLRMVGNHMTSAEIMNPTKVGSLYGSRTGLMGHLLDAVDLPR